MNSYDVTIVGGSAAGLSAALVLARARRRVLVVDAGAPRNAPAARMHGFLSRDGLPPAELLAAGRRELAAYGAEVVEGTVVELASGAGGFRLALEDGRRVSARQVVVATGLHDELPAVDGLRERWARDVLHCPYCHGWEVRDRALGVLGGGPDSARYAQVVRQWSDDVVYLAPAGTLSDVERTGLLARGVEVVEGDVRRVRVAADRLTGVELADGRVVPRDALFVPPRFTPNADLLVGIGCAVDERGWPVRDADGRTSVPGVWVAGNVANPRAQVVTAAGEGSAVAVALNADLVQDDVRAAVRALEPDRGPDTTGGGARPDPTEHSRPPAPRVGPPTKHQLALMIWLAVFPTLTVLNLALGDWLATLAPVLRTFVLATVAVPVVIYGLMPQLHKARARLLARRPTAAPPATAAAAVSQPARTSTT